ncbi:MAG: LysM peptidoglycan-binding domain-containing protein [Lachnospiraceae bacterium]
MIEIIKNEENAATKDKSIVNLPKNVRQIGEVRQDKRIYIEDYVVGYLNSLKSKCDENGGVVCVLMGQILHDEQGSYNFIRGAVLCEESPMEGESYFSQRLWTLVYKSIDRFFPDMEIVGWAGIFNDIDEARKKEIDKIFIDNFAGRMKTMYLVDLSQEDEDFYFLEEEQVKKQSGYMQFFERNPLMQEYIVAMRGQVSCEAKQADSVITNFRSLIQEKQEERSRKKARSLAYGLGSFMVVTILVLGVSLMNNYEKMSQFDQALKNLSNQFTGNDSNGNKTDIKEVNGDVYPTEPTTEATTQATTEVTTEAPTQATTEAVTQKPTQAPTQPPTQAQPSVPVTTGTYTVKAGDTLAGICRKTYGSLEKLMEIIKLNELQDANKIYVGQIIKLP